MSHSQALRAALVGGTTVLLVVALEGALRLWPMAPTDSEATSNDFHQNLPGLKPIVRYERNAEGLRALSMRAQKKPPGTLRVICIGASTTDQPTQSTEDTWCGRLEVRLRESLAPRGVSVETAAYGRGGHGVAAVERWSREHLAALEPDLVITLLGINDLAFGSAPERSGQALRGATLSENEHPPAEDTRSFSERCADASQLCARAVKVRERFRRWWEPSGATFEWHSSHLPALRAQYQAYPLVDRPAGDRDQLELFTAAIRRLLTFLSIERVPVLVLGQPVLWKANMSSDEIERLWFPIYTPQGPVRAQGDWLESEMRRYNLAQKHEAEALGHSFLDLDTRIPKTLEFFFDDCHFTDVGSERVSDEVLPYAARLLAPAIGRVHGPG